MVRHQRGAPGNPQYVDEHFGPAPEGPLHRTPKAKTEAERQFLALGDGAVLWLTEAGAAGTGRARVKMANAVSLAALHGAEAVDRALAKAAMLGRFAEGDLASILGHQASGVDVSGTPPRTAIHFSPGPVRGRVRTMRPTTTTPSPRPWCRRLEHR